MHKWTGLFLVSFILLVSPLSFAMTVKLAEKTASAHFLALSDIHFDPYLSCSSAPCPLIQKLRQSPSTQWPQIFAQYDKTKPAYFEDSNYALLTSMLGFTSHQARQQSLQFVLILGDFLGHGYKEQYKKYSTEYTSQGYQTFVRKTLEFLALELTHAFPSMNIYAVVGNNDTYQSDYASTPNGPFFKETAIVWGNFIKNPVDRQVMQKEFSTAGYYTLPLPNQKNIRLIVLNSNLFSRKAKGKNIQQAVDAEFNWLHQELTAAKEKNQKTFIIMHIPETVDIYASPRLRLFTLLVLWKPDYVNRFQAEVERFSGNIAGMFASHLHSDWFEIEKTDNGKEIPIIGIPSISPIFGNQPAFKIGTYSPSLQVMNKFTVYAYSMDAKGVWKMRMTGN